MRGLVVRAIGRLAVQLAFVIAMLALALPWLDDHACRDMLVRQPGMWSTSQAPCGWCGLHVLTVLAGVAAAAVAIVGFCLRIDELRIERACRRWRLLTPWPFKRWVSREEDLPPRACYADVGAQGPLCVCTEARDCDGRYCVPDSIPVEDCQGD